MAHHASISNKYQEPNYKHILRWYHTPDKLAKFYPSLSDECWRCEEETGSLNHIFWSCGYIQLFRTKVLDLIKQLTNIDLTGNPAACLLHLTPTFCARYKKLLIQMLNAVKTCIPPSWKSWHPPSVSEWLSRVNDIMRMEDLTASLKGTRESFDSTWFYCQQFRESREPPFPACSR